MRATTLSGGPTQPYMGFLWALSLIWRAGSALDRWRKQKRRSRLPVPVVSIGNITTGGTGKTPMAIELIQAFRQFNPGMLSRGYGRTSQETVILAGDARATVASTGDEPQLCRQSTGAPVGIGADRYATGLELIRQTGAGVLFLDDGFQALQLHRDFDLVLIDALRPFGDGNLLPLGRLREPLSGLSRASAFVITRANEVPNTRAIERVLERYNPGAPVFRAVTVPANWLNAQGNILSADEVKSFRSVAFCGLGNPDSFWRSLEDLGIQPLASHEYSDHHSYTPAELRRLAKNALDSGVDVLLTTAKDRINLDPDYAAIIHPLDLYWLEIRMEIDRREELISLIGAAVLSRTSR